MNDFKNCSECNNIYIANAFREVCESCYQNQERQFELVSTYLRKKEHRTATIVQVVEATEVDETLIYKWIKKGRILAKQFPNLGYPCTQCGKGIRKGTLCDTCASHLKKDLQTYETEESTRRSTVREDKVYYSDRK